MADEIDFRTAPVVEVDRVCRGLLRDCIHRIADESWIASVLLTGSLARGHACGGVLAGHPVVLSDVDLIVVPRTDVPASARDRLAEAGRAATLAARPAGFASHVEYGLFRTRTFCAPPDSLLLHDLAHHGRCLAGDPEPLDRLRANLVGRRPAAQEGTNLVANRIAGELWTLPSLASTNPFQRLIGRFQFAKAYVDNQIALHVVAGTYPTGDFTHPLLAEQSEAAARWAAFRADPDPGLATPTELLSEWRAVVRDQLATAQACARLAPPARGDPLRNVIAWARAAGVGSIAERLGLRGPPLVVAQQCCAELARELTAGPVDPTNFGAAARKAVGFWRRAVNGFDDTPDEYPSQLQALLRSES